MPLIDFSVPITADTDYNLALLHPRVREILADHGVLPRDEAERYAMATCPLGLALATSPVLRDDRPAQERLLAEIAAVAQPLPAVDRSRRRPASMERSRISGIPGGAEWTRSVPAYGRFELALRGPVSSNPYLDVALSARVDGPDGSVTVDGFHDEGGVYRIRFLPLQEGTYTFTTSSNAEVMHAISGAFEVTAALESAHGPVRAEGFHFRYDDGTMYRPIGTTAYGWLHQDKAFQEETVQTLAQTGFTKLRMTLMPKWFAYNETQPARAPFLRGVDGAFDVDRPDPVFWREVEHRVDQLAALGIEADIILFHPYDSWGFEDMGADADDRYVRYAIARLGAHANVWWSLANEYDVMAMKTVSDWDRIGELIRRSDPVDHLRSIHHCIEPFDHSRDWISHVSIQSMDVEQTTPWRAAWGKPVVIDECAYEGDLQYVWGNSSAEDLVRRHWDAAIRGGYAGHGETITDADGRLWWSHGGALAGQSEPRIAFLRTIMELGPAGGWEPLHAWWPYPNAGVEGEYVVAYLGATQPSHHLFVLDPARAYDVDVIDTWEMTVTRVLDAASGRIDVPLPARPYQAVRFTARG